MDETRKKPETIAGLPKYTRGEHPSSLANLQLFEIGGKGGPGRPKGSRDAFSKMVVRDMQTSMVSVGGAAYWTWLARAHPPSYVRVVTEMLRQGHVDALAGGAVGESGRWAAWLTSIDAEEDSGAKERRARALALLAQRAQAEVDDADVG